MRYLNDDKWGVCNGRWIKFAGGESVAFKDMDKITFFTGPEAVLYDGHMQVKRSDYDGCWDRNMNISTEILAICRNNQ